MTRSSGLVKKVFTTEKKHTRKTKKYCIFSELKKTETLSFNSKSNKPQIRHFFSSSSARALLHL